jgi:hypothetical protein
LSAGVAAVTIAGWIAALHGTISGTNLTHFWRIVVYLALILPTVGICLTIIDALGARMRLARGSVDPAKPIWWNLDQIEKRLNGIERALESKSE